MTSPLASADFFSANCLREIDTANKSKKPLILVHEMDASKGGAPLDDLRADCASQGRDVFDAGREIIPWHRVADFQLLALKLIARSMLHCMPVYEQLNEPPKVYIPGEIGLQVFEFRQRVTVYVSEFNPGAAEMTKEFVVRYNDRNLTFRYDPPPQLQRSRDSRASVRRLSALLTIRRLSSSTTQLTRAVTTRLPSRLPLTRHCSSFGQLSRGRSKFLSRFQQQPGWQQPSTPSADHVSHMLLYLNSTTFTGKDGQNLAYEIRRARAFGIEIVLVHENDPKRSGCAFSRLFQTTPRDLVEQGLYGKIAVASHPEPYRIGVTSLRLEPRMCPATVVHDPRPALRQ
eukprot:190475-Prymnesium_polylepis.2